MDLLPWLCCHNLRWKVGKVANSGNLDSCVWSTTKQKHEKNENVASSLASELAVLLGGKRKEVDTCSFDRHQLVRFLFVYCLSILVSTGGCFAVGLRWRSKRQGRRKIFEGSQQAGGRRNQERTFGDWVRWSKRVLWSCKQRQGLCLTWMEKKFEAKKGERG